MTPERILTFAFGLVLAGLIVTGIWSELVQPLFDTIQGALAH